MAKTFPKNKSCVGTAGTFVLTHKSRLIKSLEIIASLINAGNENLWPIFERLENELSKLEKNEARLSKYVV